MPPQKNSVSKLASNTLKTLKWIAFGLAENNKERAKSSIAMAKNFTVLSITTNIWSDGIIRNSYLDILAFFVENFRLKHELLAFRHFDESHTAKAILQKISEVANKYGYNYLIVAYITDSWANVKATFKHSEW